MFVVLKPKTEKKFFPFIKHTLINFTFYSIIRHTASGVEIIKTSEQQITVREGETLDLYCESATPYQVYTCIKIGNNYGILTDQFKLQWCYWAHNGSEYPTTSHKGGGEIR